MSYIQRFKKARIQLVYARFIRYLVIYLKNTKINYRWNESLLNKFPIEISVFRPNYLQSPRQSI